MPFRNYHAARQNDPGKYTSWARGKPEGFPEGVSVVYGIRSVGGKNKSEIQSIRFKTSQWTPDRARKWLKSHGFKSTLEVAKPVKKDFWDGVI